MKLKKVKEEKTIAAMAKNISMTGKSASSKDLLAKG
jgi:hypothetical protein